MTDLARAAAIAGRYGTPAYVYHLLAVRSAYTRLRAALPEPSTVYYSLKANPHPDLVRVLVGAGCAAEVSSVNELDTAVRSGARPADVLYTGPGKTAGELRHAIRSGVRRFSVDSPGQLRAVGTAALASQVSVSCLLRINIGATGDGSLRMARTGSQFGTDLELALRTPDAYREVPGAAVIGLHFFPLSCATDETSLIASFAASIDAARRVQSAWRTEFTELDLGGGFAAPYARPGDPIRYDGLHAEVERLLDENLAGWRRSRPQVSFESGRYLVADCGELVCAVTDVKESGGRRFVVVDAGSNHLGGMSGLRRLMPVRAVVEPWPRRGGGDVATTVAGPLCTPVDTVATSLLPEVRPGDLLVVRNVGAYGPTASLLGFLGRPGPAEVVLGDGGAVSSATALRLTRERVPARREDGT